MTEQEKQREQEWAETFAFVAESAARIDADSQSKRGVAGTVECPKCQGRLRYAVAKGNGHRVARCETPGCLAWME